MNMRDDIEFNIKFCDEVKKFPCLYDHYRADYCNRSAQDRAWLTIAKRLDTHAAECKERWKNVRGRYTKYKKQNTLPSGSGVKKIKQYYLADHLQFLDSFLKSRQSKGNIVHKKEEEATQEQDEDEEEEGGGGEDDNNEEEENSGDDNIEEVNVEQRDAPTPVEDTSKLNAPITPQHSKQKKDNMCKKRTTSPASLSDLNSTAIKYFETKKRLLENKTESTSSQLDPDLAFLQSILPDMKTMDARQKRKFKIRVLQLVDETLNTEVPATSLTASNKSNANTLFNYTSTNVFQDEIPPDLDQNVQEGGNFNLRNYLKFLPK